MDSAHHHRDITLARQNPNSSILFEANYNELDDKASNTISCEMHP